MNSSDAKFRFYIMVKLIWNAVLPEGRGHQEEYALEKPQPVPENELFFIDLGKRIR